jgi:hypothetical protein
MFLIKVKYFNNFLLSFHLCIILSEMLLTARVKKILIYLYNASLRKNPFLKLIKKYLLYAVNLNVYSINVL